MFKSIRHAITFSTSAFVSVKINGNNGPIVIQLTPNEAKEFSNYLNKLSNSQREELIGASGVEITIVKKDESLSFAFNVDVRGCVTLTTATTTAVTTTAATTTAPPTTTSTKGFCTNEDFMNNKNVIPANGITATGVNPASIDNLRSGSPEKAISEP